MNIKMLLTAILVPIVLGILASFLVTKIRSAINQRRSAGGRDKTDL
ncbi:MAG: hypothetical protein ACI3VK_02085 [Oscillospiraceae bacterium]